MAGIDGEEMGAEGDLPSPGSLPGKGAPHCWQKLKLAGVCPLQLGQTRNGLAVLASAAGFSDEGDGVGARVGAGPGAGRGDELAGGAATAVSAADIGGAATMGRRSVMPDCGVVVLGFLGPLPLEPTTAASADGSDARATLAGATTGLMFPGDVLLGDEGVGGEEPPAGVDVPPPAPRSGSPHILQKFIAGALGVPQEGQGDIEVSGNLSGNRVDPVVGPDAEAFPSSVEIFCPQLTQNDEPGRIGLPQCGQVVELDDVRLGGAMPLGWTTG